MAGLASLPTAPVARDRLQHAAADMFAAKAAKKLTFEQMAQELGRTEVAVAALFYAQAQASAEDVEKLSKLLGLEQAQLAHLTEYPTRGHTIEMPPKEPLMYRLYEIVQNFGPSYKAVLNEKFGDGIMSAIAFSTNVEKETDDAGVWCKITLRGKWLPYTRF